MAWNEGLSPDQENAAGHVGSHARLLAGPGTGKTHVIARRILFLIEEQGVDPLRIVVLTFTRAAAAELRERVTTEVGDDRVPRIATLHSFALRQLLKNSARVDALPQPLRVADDWEERHIIYEDMKRALDLDRIKQVRELFAQLAADWETLRADREDYTPDPRFLGAWNERRRLYGYTLRSELIYQLKRAIEQLDDFEMDEPVEHLIVDEYQDLNKCDLAVIQAVVNRGAELFAAGDDDQSIYGFRKADPDGIRELPVSYPGVTDLPLQVCRRCDPEILNVAEFVAALDPRRIDKGTRPEEGRERGTVRLVHFRNQGHEAQGVARLCRLLISNKGYRPEDILILLRSDWRGAFSDVLMGPLLADDIEVAVAGVEATVLDDDPGRAVLAALRLSAERNDDLAWRTLLQVRRNQLGEQAIERMSAMARDRGIRFSAAVEAIADDPNGFPRGQRLRDDVQVVNEAIADIDAEEETDLKESVRRVAGALVEDDDTQREIVDYFSEVTDRSGAKTLTDLLRNLESVGTGLDQELVEGAINILTMHRAKGLTAKAVVVVAAEDEHIPGRQEGEDESDERRLLYVSLSRAKHDLIVTYCRERRGQQQRLGSGGGAARRHLTRFLRDSPLRPVTIAAVLEEYGEEGE